MIITIKHQTLELRVFETEIEALSSGNDHMLITDEATLERTVLTSGQLRDIYNSIKTENPVNKFEDREAAVRRTFAALQEHFSSATSGGSESDGVTTEEDDDMAQSTKIKSKKKTAKAPKTAKAAKAPKTAKAPKVAKAAKAPKVAKEKKSSRNDFCVSPTNGNQFRVGTKSHKDFQKVVDKPGRTFSEYVKDLHVHPGILAHAIKIGHAKKTKAPA